VNDEMTKKEVIVAMMVEITKKELKKDEEELKNDDVVTNDEMTKYEVVEVANVANFVKMMKT